MGATNKQVQKFLRLQNDNTVAKWYRKIRIICSWTLRQRPIRIGGVGHIGNYKIQTLK